MPKLLYKFEKKTISKLVTIKCYPWSYKDKAVIIGDASHAIVPFYGQGMNSGFEDCTIFNELLEEHAGKLSEVLSHFEKQRKPDADAISDLAMSNFIEMRDHVADEEFLLRKRLEARIYKEYPDKWIPLYSRVTFSHERYSKALANGQKQEAIMKRVMKIADLKNKWQNMSLAFIIDQL